MPKSNAQAQVDPSQCEEFHVDDPFPRTGRYLKIYNALKELALENKGLFVPSGYDSASMRIVNKMQEWANEDGFQVEYYPWEDGKKGRRIRLIKE